MSPRCCSTSGERSAGTTTSSSTTSPAPLRRGRPRRKALRAGRFHRHPVIRVELTGIEPGVDRVVIAASAEGGSFGQVPGLSLTVTDPAGASLAEFAITDASVETAFRLRRVVPTGRWLEVPGRRPGLRQRIAWTGHGLRHQRRRRARARQGPANAGRGRAARRTGSPPDCAAATRGRVVAHPTAHRSPVDALRPTAGDPAAGRTSPAVHAAVAHAAAGRQSVPGLIPSDPHRWSWPDDPLLTEVRAGSGRRSRPESWGRHHLPTR